MTERQSFIGSELACHHGVLLMESHGLAPDVRAVSFSSTKVWTKLYQAGPYFLDLNLGPDGDALVLQGEILIQDGTSVPSSGTVTLHSHEGGIEASATLDDTSSGARAVFAFPIGRADTYHLGVAFDQEVLSIVGLKV